MNSLKQAAVAYRSLSAVGTAAWRAPDPIEELKERYVSGWDTLEEFERCLETELRSRLAPNPQPEVET